MPTGVGRRIRKRTTRVREIIRRPLVSLLIFKGEVDSHYNAMLAKRGSTSTSTRPFKRYKRSFPTKSVRGAYVKTSNRKFQNAVRRAVNTVKETCFLDFSYGKNELFHNTYTTGTCLYQLNDATKMPTQGDGDSNRTGNVIQPLSMTLRVMALFKGDRLNAKIRFMVLSFPKGIVPGNTGAFMDAVTGNLHMDPLDRGRVRVHIDKKIGYRNINPGVATTAKEVTIFRNFRIKMKGRITFFDDGAQENNQVRDYYAIAIAYDTFGSLVTDNVGAIQLWRRFSWKDI